MPGHLGTWEECCMAQNNNDILMHGAMQNKMKINDWSSIQTLFDELNKKLEKIQKTPGSTGEPRHYIKMLVELEVGTSGMYAWHR